MFFFLPLIDTKIDQPEVELVLDRDKVAAMGLDMRTVGADLATLVGGNFVNRFNFDGLSYKVIPQLKRIARLDPSQLENTSVKGPNGRLVQLSTFATLKKKTEPRSLNRFQQLNAVKLSGAPARPLGEVLDFMEREARKILPQGYKIDYAGNPGSCRRGQQVPARIHWP
jgi:multidrug efflux pump